MITQAFASVDPAERDVVASALTALVHGQKLSRRQQAAMKRIDKAWTQRFRDEAFRTVTLADWRKWSSRTAAQIKEQASRYALPIGGPVISIPDLAESLHRFLAERARQLASPESDESLMFGGTSPNLERYRAARADREEMSRDLEAKKLISRDVVHVLIEGWFAGIRAARSHVWTLPASTERDELLRAFDDAMGIARMEWRRFMVQHFGEPEEGEGDGEADDVSEAVD